MPTVADVLRQHGPEYLEQFGDAMPAEQKKVLCAIMACRTGQLGSVHYYCTSCGRVHVMGRSCGNRHCPTCQHNKAKAWLDKQTERLLPCPYFLVTFTVPTELRAFIRSHPRACYAAMFEASSEALKALAADPKYVGTKSPGFFGVLHTWGRTLATYHPHIHYVVPGGGVSQDGSEWKASRANFFVPVKALSILYRATFKDAMQRAGLLGKIDPAVWNKEFLTDSRAVGDGRQSLQYLAPYVFRVAISDRRIMSIDEAPDGSGRVTFLYKKTGSRRWRKMTVDALEFIRRFLQHVLPSGFQKVRHFGFLSPKSKTGIEAVRWLVAIHYQQIFALLCTVQQVKPPPPRIRCAECGAEMIAIRYVTPEESYAARAPPAWASAS